MKISYTAHSAALKTSFDTMAHLVTEDFIRHLFIDVQSLSKLDTVIEKPYRLLRVKSKFKTAFNNRERADVYYFEKEEDVVLEFKYHKKSLYGSDTAKTTNMGEVFRDLNRLSILDHKEKYLMYVFDQEMKNYYDKYVFDILKTDSNQGKILQSTEIEPLIAGKKVVDFKKAALSSFDENAVKDFNDFDYEVEVLYSDRITTYKTINGNSDSMYLLFLQVK